MAASMTCFVMGFASGIEGVFNKVEKLISQIERIKNDIPQKNLEIYRIDLIIISKW